MALVAVKFEIVYVVPEEHVTDAEDAIGDAIETMRMNGGVERYCDTLRDGEDGVALSEEDVDRWIYDESARD